MVRAKSQFRGRLEHIVSFRSWRLTNTGPKTACTYKYTWFQALASVLRDEPTTNPAIDPQSQHGFNAISPNQTVLTTSQRGKPVSRLHFCEETHTSAFQQLTRFTSFALLCFSTDTTHPASAAATNSGRHHPKDSKTRPRAGTKANAMLSRAGRQARASEESVPASA